MNIVYPYKHFNPAELIYSLKSLKNYKDAGEVFIIGDSPRNDLTGFTLLEHEPATWAGCSRYHDVTSKIYQYAKTHTGDFLLLNDDMFLLSDYTPTNYQRGALLDLLREGNMTSYKQSQVYMLNWLRRQGLPLLSYELHVPMVINCEKAIETIELMASTIQFGNILMFRTVYGNMHLTDAEQLNDVKNIADYYGKPLLSTNEQTFEHGEIGKYVRTVLDGGKPVKPKPKPKRKPTDKLKIAALTHFSIEAHGSGGEWYLHLLLKALAKKHDTSCYTHEAGIDKTIDGVKYIYSGIHKFSEDKHDIVISQFVHSMPTAIRYSMANKIPAVQLIHNPNSAYKTYIAQVDQLGGLNIFNSLDTQFKLGYSTGDVMTPIIKKVNTKTGNKVTLVNVMPTKGSDIFYQLAERMPETEFLAVIGGYSNRLQVLRRLPNVEIIKNTDIAEVFAKTKVILMPSSAESFGMVALEAAQVGIPAITSNLDAFKENLGKAAICLPLDDIDAWEGELNKLLKDKKHYDKRSKLSKERYKEYQAAHNVQEIIKKIERLA